MQRCELAEECCVCNVPFCPYEDDDYDYWSNEDLTEDQGIEDEGW